MRPDMYSQAVAYTGIGWWVFAKKPSQKQPPGGSHDYLDARLDPGPWQRNPSLNIALAPGPSGLLVLDDDTRDPDALTAFARMMGDDALDTPIQETGGGGHHIFYRAPDPEAGLIISKMKLEALPGWEALGAKANVVLSPSIHPNGRYYAWLPGHSPWRVRPRPMPEPLTQMIREQQAHKHSQLAEQISPATISQQARSRYGEAMLSGCLAELPATPEHHRNDKLNSVSYRLGRAVGGGLLGWGEVERELIRAGLAMGLTSREVPATVQSGMQAGIKQPLYLAGEWQRLERSRQ